MAVNVMLTLDLKATDAERLAFGIIMTAQHWVKLSNVTTTWWKVFEDDSFKNIWATTSANINTAKHSAGIRTEHDGFVMIGNNKPVVV